MLGMLRVVNIHKRFGDLDVLRGVSLELGRGEVLTIMGPNGSGKTTLLRIIALLEKPDSGFIEFEGSNLTYTQECIDKFKSILAFVPQKPPILSFSVFNNIYLPLRAAGFDSHLAREVSWDMLNIFGLNVYAHKNANKLSTGERQLLALARALALNPRVMLLDEPTAHLDAKHAVMVRNFLKDYVHRRNIYLIVVSHSVDEAKFLSDKLMILVSGVVKALYSGGFDISDVERWL